MEERRIAKTINIKEYRRLNNQLRRETDRAKEVYMEEKCEEIMQNIGISAWCNLYIQTLLTN